MTDINDLKEKLSSSLWVVNKYEWLLNSYMLDFFVDEHWSKLPVSWHKVFNDIEISELGELILDNKISRIYPLSFLSLIAFVNRNVISRTPSNKDADNRTVLCYENERKDEKQNFSSDIISNCKTKTINNIFMKRIKKKKRHEISLMSELVRDTAENIDCRAVTDIGSGLGHLLRTLAYKYNMKTVGIEAQSELVSGARKIDDQFNITVSKYLKDEPLLDKYRPHHINTMLTQSNKLTVIENIKDTMGDSFGLIGLHPCGDLGPLLLEMFKDTSEIKFICIVGCCFMKLSCDAENFRGYPLSSFVSNIKYNRLSYESRELACHAIETYCQRLKKGLYQDLQIHCFRALLEKIIVSKWPNLKHSGLKSIKHYNTLTFEKYCEIATERLGIKLTAQDINTEEIEGKLRQWRRVVIFYTLRLILAPLVESVILMDRMLYLRENGISSEIMAVFDPCISPRNHVLIAKKKL